MADMMTFPNTVEEFMEQYKIVDTEKIYTNGADLVPIFRMMQWFEHVSATNINVGDMINRQQEIDAMCLACGHDCDKSKFVYNAPQDEQVIMCPEHYALSTMPSAQPEQRLDEWCTNCKEYDHENHCCPRWTKVIRQTRRELQDEFVMTAVDGTLWVTVDDVQKVGRVIVDEDKSKFCRQFYMDAQPEPCEDAVSREAVLDAIDEWKEACTDSGHKETVSDIKLIRKDFIELPPVTPKQRTGKWILDRSGAYCCSECMEPCAGYVMMKPRDKFCKMCGAKMEGVSNDTHRRTD